MTLLSVFSRGAAAGLLAGALAAPAARAQTPLGQPSLDEAKVQIWCATARYVYQDGGRARLLGTLRCEGGNLPALAASLRPDSLRIYSLLYAPIEEQGRIYRGRKDNPARLRALVQAIVRRLGASPSRRRDPTRLAGLQALEKKLTDYVESGLPPTDATPAPAATPEASPSGAAPPGPAEAAEAAAPAGVVARPAAAPAAGESLLNRVLAPLAFTFSLLSLVLYALLRRSLGQSLRQLRRDSLAAPYAELTAAQRQEVEELITRRLAENQSRS